MNRLVLLFAAGIVLLLAGCNSGVDGFQIPPQQFSGPMDTYAGPEGTLFGRILFPSEYTQRSVRFSVGGRDFVTHPDGRFLIEGIPAGTRKFRVHVRSYEPVDRSLVIEADRPVAAGEYQLRVARGWVIGRLVSENGESGAEISVKLLPRDELAVTDGEGIFQFIGVNSGAHVLRVMDKDFFTYNRKFTLGSGERRNLGNIKVFVRSGSALARSSALHGGRPDVLPDVQGIE